MTITGRRLTLEEFLALPEEEPALEFFRGQVTQKVSPGTWHSLLRGAFVFQVYSYVRPRRLAHVLPEHRSTYGTTRPSRMFRSTAGAVSRAMPTVASSMR